MFGGRLSLVPQGGAAKSQPGGIDLIASAMIDYYAPSGGNPDPLPPPLQKLKRELARSEAEGRH